MLSAGGYANAADLVAGLKRLHPFEISVAAYPDYADYQVKTERSIPVFVLTPRTD